MSGQLRWTVVVQSALVAAMFVAAALAWSAVPDVIAVHWGFSGRPDRFAGKVEGLLGLPVIALLVALVLRYLPRMDPLRARYTEFASAYSVVCTAVVGLLGGIYAAVLLSALGVVVNMTQLAAALVGVLLVVIGSVLDQLRRNWFVGIRTPWTLSSERSWTATHRVGRWVFMAAGVCLILAAVVQSTAALIAASLCCVAGVLGLVAYSYMVWREDEAHAARGSRTV